MSLIEVIWTMVGIAVSAVIAVLIDRRRVRHQRHPH